MATQEPDKYEAPSNGGYLWQQTGDKYNPGVDDVCSVEGTEILLLSGYSKRIENIKPFTPDDMTGDVVMAIDGTPAYVVATYSGATKIPCVEIRVESDSGRHQITVTPFHSLMVNHFSMVQAGFLRVGDKLITKSGEATVRSVGHIAYKGRVWNLFLASEAFIERMPKMSPEAIYACRRASLLGLSPKQHMYFANGICSGDFMIQCELRDFYRRGFDVSRFA